MSATYTSPCCDHVSPRPRYNLCSERFYAPSRFYGRVVRYPFDDHTPCPFNMLLEFVVDVDEWLSGHPQNVAVVHCKVRRISNHWVNSGLHRRVICMSMEHRHVLACTDVCLLHPFICHVQAGKGRSGLMIAAYLLHAQQVDTAEDALQLFATQRMNNGDGVSIPSQKRYVQY